MAGNNAIQATTADRPVWGRVPAVRGPGEVEVSDWDITRPGVQTVYYLANESNDSLYIDTPSFTGAATVGYATEHGNYVNDGMTIPAADWTIPMDGQLRGLVMVPGSATASQKASMAQWLAGKNPGVLAGTDTHKATLTVNQSASDAVNLTITTSDGEPYSVDWGDGNTSVDVASGAEATNTYSADYNGPIVITAKSGIIRELESDAIQIEATGDELPDGLVGLDLFDTDSTITSTGYDLPSGLTDLNLGKTNSAVTSTGSDLPSGVSLLYLFLTNSVITSTGSELPSGITDLRLYGTDSAITATGSELPSGITGLDLYDTNSAITSTGTDLPVGMLILRLGQSNSVITSFDGWASDTTQYVGLSDLSLTSGVVDDVLIELDADVATWGGLKTIALGGNNAARTSASDAAKASLIGKGVTVSVNE